MMMKHACALALTTIVLAGCRASLLPPETDTHSVPTRIKGKSIQAQTFGKARLAVGMTKVEVLAQISLSRTQYKPLKSETSAQLYVSQPSQETIEADNWFLTCPSRNAHLLGGGSGIMLQLTFTDGKVSTIEQLPWLGA